MAAGLGFKTFNTGEVLTSADVNGYLMQGVLVFASEAARNAAITSPQEGQFAYTKDNNSLWYYTGSAWAASGATGDIEGVTAGTGISGGGTSGTVTITNSMATAIDAKGDLVVGTGADTFSRLAVGANDTVLVAASGEATGLKWAAPSSGGLTLITETVASANSSVSFSSIPATYKQLLMIVTGLVIDGSSTAQQTFSLKVNSLDSIYVNQRTTVDDTGTSVRFATDTHLEFFNAVTTTTLENSVNGYILIDNYSSTSKVKNFCFARAAQDRQSNVLRTQSWQGFFNTTAAIDTVAIVRQIGSGNLSNLSNTSVRLYGVS